MKQSVEQDDKPWQFKKGREKTGGRKKGTPNNPMSIKVGMKTFTENRGKELLDFMVHVMDLPDYELVGDKVVNHLPTNPGQPSAGEVLPGGNMPQPMGRAVQLAAPVAKDTDRALIGPGLDEIRFDAARTVATTVYQAAGDGRRPFRCGKDQEVHPRPPILSVVDGRLRSSLGSSRW